MTVIIRMIDSSCEEYSDDFTETVKMYIPRKKENTWQDDYDKAVTYAQGYYADELIEKGYTEEEANKREEMNGVDAFICYMENRGYEITYIRPDYEFEW